MKKLKKILIIDDDKITAYLHKVLLESLEVAREIVCIHDSHQALDYVHTHYRPAPEKASEPDLIFLDLEMPGLNGFQFLDKLDELIVDQGNVSIVMLTTSLYGGDRRKANAYIGNKLRAYLVKPLQREVVRELVEDMQ